MVAHVLFPAVAPEPASLSRRWVQNALREELRFEGAVFTDDLSMGGAAEYGDIVARATAALAAGCDVLPVCNDRASVAQAARRARITRSQPSSHLRLVRMRGTRGAGTRRAVRRRRLARQPGTAGALRRRARAESHGGQRMNGFQGDFLRGALDVSPEGVVICEAGGDRLVVYVNPAFCRLTGLRRQRTGRQEPAHAAGRRSRSAGARSRCAMRCGTAEPVRALLRNVRKDGTVFVNDMQIYPLKDGNGQVTHFIGYHREGGTRTKTGESGIRGLPNWVREDRLTGLASRYYFEDVLKRDFALAQRDKTDIALLLFDIDQLGPYNEIFDRAGGDAVVKRVARAIAGSFRRGTDIVGRWEGASVIVLMHGTPARSCDPARHHGRAPRARTADPSSALARRNT